MGMIGNLLLGFCGIRASNLSFGRILLPLKVCDDKSGSVKTPFGEQLVK